MCKTIQMQAFRDAFHLRCSKRSEDRKNLLIYFPVTGIIYSLHMLIKTMENKPKALARIAANTRLKDLPNLPLRIQAIYKASVVRYALGSVPVFGRLFVPLLDITGTAMKKIV